MTKYQAAEVEPGSFSSSIANQPVEKRANSPRYICVPFVSTLVFEDVFRPLALKIMESRVH